MAIYNYKMDENLLIQKLDVKSGVYLDVENLNFSDYELYKLDFRDNFSCITNKMKKLKTSNTPFNTALNLVPKEYIYIVRQGLIRDEFTVGITTCDSNHVSLHFETTVIYTIKMKNSLTRYDMNNNIGYKKEDVKRELKTLAESCLEKIFNTKSFDGKKLHEINYYEIGNAIRYELNSSDIYRYFSFVDDISVYMVNIKCTNKSNINDFYKEEYIAKRNILLEASKTKVLNDIDIEKKMKEYQLRHQEKIEDARLRNQEIITQAKVDMIKDDYSSTKITPAEAQLYSAYVTNQPTNADELVNLINSTKKTASSKPYLKLADDVLFENMKRGLSYDEPKKIGTKCR